MHTMALKKKKMFLSEVLPTCWVLMLFCRVFERKGREVDSRDTGGEEEKIILVLPQLRLSPLAPPGPYIKHTNQIA